MAESRVTPADAAALLLATGWDHRPPTGSLRPLYDNLRAAAEKLPGVRERP